MNTATGNREQASRHLGRLFWALLVAILALLLFGAAHPTGAHAAATPAISVTDFRLPRSDRVVCARPTGTIPWAAFGGASFVATAFGAPDQAVISWSAGTDGDGFLLEVLADGEEVDSIRLPGSARSYTWKAHAPYGGPYRKSYIRLSLLSDPAQFVDSSPFCLSPWGAPVAEFDGLEAYSNFPGPTPFTALGDTGYGPRYQCVELARRWCGLQGWTDWQGRPLPSRWNLFWNQGVGGAKDMLVSAAGLYGLTVVRNDGTDLPEVGDLLVWDGGLGGSGGCGHVAVVTGVDAAHVGILEENWSRSGEATLKVHTGFVEDPRVSGAHGHVAGWIKPTHPRTNFSDVSSSPYRAAIQRLAAAGVVAGIASGEFQPESPVLRAQFAKMICGAFFVPVQLADTCSFWDVEKSAKSLYPEHYVAVAYELGITEGVAPHAFAPYKNVTRAQAISMIVRAAQTLHHGLLATPPAVWRGALPAVDPTHGPQIRSAEFNHLLDGIDLAAWDVWGRASRGEVAQMLRNLWSLPEF
jgi:hypothetical protein